MLAGLVAYEDDSASEDEQKQTTSPLKSASSAFTHDVKQKTSLPTSSEPRKVSNKSQIIIKRPPAQHKTHMRAVASDPIADSSPEGLEQPEASTSALPQPKLALPGLTEPADELVRIRELLRPPQIPGLDNWGIPPASGAAPDPAIAAKLAQFQALKNAQPPRHFNDSLMGSRAFRNPHLYAKLVEFVDVDERTTNFPTALWDPGAMDAAWYADAIGVSHFHAASSSVIHAETLYNPSSIIPVPVSQADLQKARSEQQSQGQTSGKRTQIAFSSAGTSSSTTTKSRRENDKDRDKRFQPYGGGKRDKERARSA
ncbi:unnamed protein product [Mycena citricolor]|uniref:HCNGP-domain-containing protein n=1 Tax=Mycena citricolor TaxID=2018698 RepID=A0AAD2HBL2_9AGAR|nr:unnamed protein product [Mycena citricolor]